jgi:2-oxoglutarate ferredoxin oxidoreductase subunit delta
MNAGIVTLHAGHGALMHATVTIDQELCKGCLLCIPVCPPKVLEMSTAVNSKGYRYPLLLDGCTGCELCAKVCPDFCFEVYRRPRGAPGGAMVNAE